MDKLGIEPTLLLAQLVNFTIIVVVLSKLLYKPILSMLEKRKKEITEGLALTEKMRVEEEKMGEKRKEMCEQASREAQEIFKEAQKRAHDEEAHMLSDAHKKADEIVEKAKKEAEMQKELLQDEIKKEAVTLGTAIAKRLLAEVMTDDVKRKLASVDIRKMKISVLKS